MASVISFSISISRANQRFLLKVCFDERKNGLDVRASNVMLSSWKDVKFGIGKQMQEFLPDANGADGIVVAPDQKNGNVDPTKLGCEIGIVGGKPIGETRLLVFESLSPVNSTKPGCVKTSRSGHQHQVRYEGWSANCRFDGKHASHGLSN